MKILQLNVWMGKVEGGLRRFLEQNDFDVICMQEVFAAKTENVAGHLSRLCFDLAQIQKASRLPYQFFAPNWGSKIADGTFELGNLILSKIPFTETTSQFIHGEYKDNTVLGQVVGNNLNIQIAKLENGLTVVNHHGFWRPDPMGDAESVAAFARVGEIIKALAGPVVMCGDLNVIHQSPAMRALDFLRDLTDENQVATTLSGLKYDGLVPCDHILVNDQVEVKAFRVIPDIVSDHLGITAEVKPV